MICSLCGLHFNEADGVAACQSCLFSKRCELIKCPNCGYEIPREPKWINRLRIFTAKKRHPLKGIRE